MVRVERTISLCFFRIISYLIPLGALLLISAQFSFLITGNRQVAARFLLSINNCSKKKIKKNFPFFSLFSFVLFLIIKYIFFSLLNSVQTTTASIPNLHSIINKYHSHIS